MDCILLCAGYATRMYPLTENFPKPLLQIKGKTIIDYLIDDLEKNHLIERYIIVSNHKFYSHFMDWRKSRKEDILILDDGSTYNENRLGAVKDIWFAVEQASINDDILVLAGDNLLDFSLKGFIDFFESKNNNAVMRYFEKEIKRLQRTGVAVI
ncbi:MAG: NTP transferase domain-containing protein, partial [Anaeroplasmataceae bacterium]|nr:NTP transferase domain-containing protein [Anaeroplasmataceae bacterium]